MKIAYCEATFSTDGVFTTDIRIRFATTTAAILYFFYVDINDMKWWKEKTLVY